MPDQDECLLLCLSRGSPWQMTKLPRDMCRLSAARRSCRSWLVQVQSAVLIMLRSIKRFPKISHCSCRKVIELYLEFFYFIPKPLKWTSLRLHSRANLIIIKNSNSSDHMIQSNPCSSTRRLRPPQSLSVAATGKGGKPIMKIRKLKRPLFQPCPACLREITIWLLSLPSTLY